jgi:hypothetical protein
LVNNLPPAPKAKVDVGRFGLRLAVGSVALLVLWLGWSLRQANNRAADDALAARDAFEVQMFEARKIGVVRGAEAMAAAIIPLLDMRSKDQLKDETALQQICEHMAQGGGFEFAAIADTTGSILASSDARYTGKRYPGLTPSKPNETEKDGLYEVSRPAIRGGILFGAVVVRAR